MVWRCACGLDLILQLIFVTFPLWKLCQFSQVRHQLHRSSIYFLSLLPLYELSHFSTSIYRQWVPCECNSSYNFMMIFLKLYTCFLHGLKMCLWFGYNPCIYFCHFFHFVNFVIFWPQILWKYIDSGYLMRNSSYNFIPIFFKFCTCFLNGLEMCMWIYGLTGLEMCMWIYACAYIQ